jgi:PUB domain
MDLDQLEDMREDVLDRISELEAEATSIFAHYALEKLVMILGNILKNPHEDKFKTLKIENQVFYSNIGRFSTGISFLKAIGFETKRLPENNKLAYYYG